jgi:hypothetical protein
VSKVDWVGKWFELGTEIGEFTLSRGGRIRPGETEPSWTFFPHAEVDGIGALVTYLRSEGVDVPIPKRAERKPSLLTRWLALWRLLRRPKKASVQPWRNFDASWKATVPEAAKPTSVAWRLLSHEDTRRIIAHAKASKAILPCYMHCALQRAIDGELLGDAAPFGWMVPVNMRGLVDAPSETANASVGLRIDASRTSTPRDLQTQLKQKLKAHVHWGVWLLSNIGRLVGKAGMRRLAKGEASFVGVFAGMGDWSLPGVPPDVHYFSCPPVAKGCPLGAGAISWQGRMGVTLQSHPVLRASQADVDKWLNAWIQLAIQGMGKPSRSDANSVD